MKKYLKISISFFLMLIIFLPKIVLADVVVHDPYEDFYDFFNVVVFIIGSLIAVLLIIILIVKIDERRYFKKRETGKVLKMRNIMDAIATVIYVFTTFLAIIMIPLVFGYADFDGGILGLFFTFVILSITLRASGKRTSAQTIIGIITILASIIGILILVPKTITESYEYRLYQYHERRIINDGQYYTRNVEGLLNEIEDMNKGLFKVKVKYDNNNYTSKSEIEELKNKIKNEQEDNGPKYYIFNYYEAGLGDIEVSLKKDQ